MKKLTQEEIRKREDKLASYTGDDRIVPSEELGERLAQEAPMAIPTGLPSLDRLLNGVEPGELILVSGPTGEGKTTLLMSITKNMAAGDTPSAWFTLEVTPEAFIRKIKKGSGGVLPHFYLPNKNTDNQIDWLEERIIEAKVKFDVKVVFIDHVHQIFSLHKLQNPNISLELGDMVSRIKQMAIDHHLVIFLIAHTRDNSTNPNAEPRKEEIRDSGLISRLADAIVLVWRVKNDAAISDRPKDNRRPTDLGEEDIRAKVRVVKNRREGRLGTFFMHHENGLLREVEF